ncbi:hypothetical protein SADUNF_Sadunf07G0055300 [Salix dunnii]|uniref:Uncharacterized protein n=1 Tax=Salix dunnii TaxID=1413687 RepID=A0A835N2A0_9ROSI|nr:hypothetical protein SADUNF_Sadunf07G0055300 [Salix dunnii]
MSLLYLSSSCIRENQEEEDDGSSPIRFLEQLSSIIAQEVQHELRLVAGVKTIKKNEVLKAAVVKAMVAGAESESEIVDVEGAYCYAKCVMKVVSSGNSILLPTSVVPTWKLKCRRI